MAYDNFNTRNGQIGFEVELANGRVFRELDSVWDEVPKGEPIKKLSIVHFPTGKVYVSFSGLDRYGFSNRASTSRDNNDAVHLGKVLIGVHGSRAVAFYMDFDGVRMVSARRDLDPNNTGFAEAVFRP